ncbi:MAG: sigma 54-interacting transcriptional regulator [Myxococcota bacterium]
MSTDDRETVPRRVAVMPVRLLALEAVEGPDTGKRWQATRDELRVGTARDNDAVLCDEAVSRFHLSLSARPEGVELVDHGSTNGTYVGRTRVGRGVVPLGTEITLGQSRLRIIDAGPGSVALHAEAELGGLVGRTPAMRRLMAEIEQLAATDVSVLITGESGSGKEVVAQAIHGLSRRHAGPFITVDCGALAPNLVVSELFGHERGAFTGADATRVGAFERAHGGTLFLDEIAELPLELQATLLGALERRRFRRVGGSRDIVIDTRVLSATHHDLHAEINAGLFRLDLYYRLGVVTVRVPPLREHPTDIPLLAEHFLRQAGHRGPVEEVLGGEHLHALAAYAFPGNARELRNIVESALALGTPAIPASSANHPGKTDASGDAIARAFGAPYSVARAALLEEFERRYLADLLARTQGNVSEAARLGGMNRSHLTDLLKRHRLR